MKYLALLLFVIGQLTTYAQVKGNKTIITQTLTLDNLRSLEMNLYAQATIDTKAREELTITADENLIDLIDFTINDGHMILTQKEWIKPSQRIQIKIGAPNLEAIKLSVHEKLVVQNIDKDAFSATAIIGQLVLQGRANTLSLNGEIGEIEALDMKAKIVQVQLWSHGKIVLDQPESITGSVKADGQVLYNGTQTDLKVKTETGGRIFSTTKRPEEDPHDTRFIDIKIKNNSLNRINCYVKGPKPDGRYFSYGFPLYPGQVRQKNWTIGSKVYRVTNLGTRKLLVEIKPTDEGKIVKLYRE